MNGANLRYVLLGAVCLGAAPLWAQDWPQWRGPNGDAKAIGFEAPKTWPKELKEKWKITVGDGVATPALVGDRLFVFSRQDGQEVIRALAADSGKELWAEKWPSAAVTGPASGFSGPRASPAVADNKVVVLGVHGSLACFQADSGKEVWRVNEFRDSVPRFATSSSPLILGGLCIAQLGGERGGEVGAFGLADGKEKWRWTGDGTSYASPAVAGVDGTRVVVAETANNLVALNVADGKPQWKSAYKTRYNASTPVTDGDRVFFSGSGQGTKAVKLEKKDNELKAVDLWSNPDYSVIYNTPVVKDGLLYGLTDGNKLYCLDVKDGKKVWDTALAAGSSGGGGGGGRPGRMGGGRGGYGSIVDAGPVLMALTPAGELIVFEAGGKEFKQLARYAVGKGTYAYPVVSGKRIFIKDSTTVVLWTLPE